MSHADRSDCRLARKLGLREPDPLDQDWYFVNTDSNRVGEWIEFLKSSDLPPSEHWMMVHLVIGSFNDALREGSSKPEDWAEICRMMECRLEYYQEFISYWGSFDDPDLPDEDCFPVGVLFRKHFNFNAQ